jgi:S1-C subfamily serine protease
MIAKRLFDLTFCLIASTALLQIPVAGNETLTQGNLDQASVPTKLLATFADAQTRVVKIYGAGLGEGLESYQSGFIVSADGLILTAWSTVLDVDNVRVVSSEGKKWDATLVGVDPVAEIALLKIDTDGLPFFTMEPESEIEIGNRVFAISNLFGIATGDEASSIQKGVVMARGPLQASRGTIKTMYRGEVVFIDVMTNNPGAKGGALIDGNGQLVGMLGKELRDENSGIWINYALPVSALSQSMKSISEGKTVPVPEAVVLKNPHKLERLGLVLLPDVLPRTPAFIDRVVPESLAEKSGLMPNDLVLLVNSQRVGSRRDLVNLLSQIDQADSFTIVVQRSQELLTIEVRP